MLGEKLGCCMAEGKSIPHLPEAKRGFFWHAEGTDDLEGLNRGEMLSMIKFGADRIFKAAEGEAPSDQDLEAILDRSNAAGQAGE